MTIFKVVIGKNSHRIIDTDDLSGKSVSEIDADLAALFNYAAMALGLRQSKARYEDPYPPTLDMSPHVKISFKRDG